MGEERKERRKKERKLQAILMGNLHAMGLLGDHRARPRGDGKAAEECKCNKCGRNS